MLDVIQLTCTIHVNKDLAMGRKRNQGKARRAAKAKAREEADEGENNNNQTANNSSEEQSLSAQMRQLQMGDEKCRHGLFDPSISTDITQFIIAFNLSFREAAGFGDQSIARCLVDAEKATRDEFADVWNDSTKMEIAISYLLCLGTNAILKRQDDTARDCATFARCLEQYIAVLFKQTQALVNWPKIEDTYFADLHTLVKFFRHRIPCSCLDEKYKEVKHITKMGHCYNPQCSISRRKVERSKTKYCSRCRCVTYCSRECQVADWKEHALDCDDFVAMIAKFEAKRQE